MKNPFHIMIIPTLGCPGRCKYCWSSEEGAPIMSIDTVKDSVAWLKNFRKDRITFTFHGGEPLLAGAEFYRQALPMLAGELAGDRIEAPHALHGHQERLVPGESGFDERRDLVAEVALEFVHVRRTERRLPAQPGPPAGDLRFERVGAFGHPGST